MRDENQTFFFLKKTILIFYCFCSIVVYSQATLQKSTQNNSTIKQNEKPSRKIKTLVKRPMNTDHIKQLALDKSFENQNTETTDFKQEKITYQSPNWLWVAKSGADIAGPDSGSDIVLDTEGNTYVTGKFEGTVNFGSFSLTSTGSTDIFIAKLDANGKWLWATKAGGYDVDEGVGITIDKVGNIYVIGKFSGTATFHTHSFTSRSYSDIFVAKLDANGKWLWANQAGGSYSMRGTDIKADDLGNVYIAGSFGTDTPNYQILTTTFGSFSLTSTGKMDVFVAKLDTNGNWEWATKAGGSTSSDVVNAIAIDSIGNCYLTGGFTSETSFGSFSLNQDRYGSFIFVAKLGSDGIWQWATQTHDPSTSTNYQDSKAITIDKMGNCYITGTLIYYSNGEDKMFVVKLDSNGDLLWDKKVVGVLSFGEEGISRGRGITVDTNGKIYVTGQFSRTVSFDSISITSYKEELLDPWGVVSDTLIRRSIFVVKLNEDGNWQWVTTVLASGGCAGFNITIDETESIYITGYFSEEAYFNPYSIESSTYFDDYWEVYFHNKNLFVAKLAPLDSNLKANFEADITSGMSPLIVNFTNLSTGNPTDFEWIFEGGIPSTFSGKYPPPIRYNIPGNFDVTLAVTSESETLTEYRTDYVTINELPEENIPLNLLATSNEANPNDVELNWMKPERSLKMRWDDDKSDDGYLLDMDTGDSLRFTILSHWDPSDLLPYNDGYLSEISFWISIPDSAFGCEYALKAFTGSAMETQILNQAFDETNINNSGWTTVPLSSPVRIDATIDLWFGVYLDGGTNTNHPLFGTDTGPAIKGKGDVIYDNILDSIQYLSDLSTNLNWSLTATFDSKLVDSYNIYRDNVRINTTEVIKTNYKDTSLIDGSYEYSVTALYPNGESAASDRINITLPFSEALFPNFAVSKNRVSTWDTIDFTDLSRGLPETWEWNFEGGFPSAFLGQNPPPIQYRVPGYYEVSLTVKNGPKTLTENRLYDYIIVDNIPETNPPRDLIGEIAENNPNEVLLNWSEPLQSYSIRWDDGNPSSFFIKSDSSKYTILSHWSPSDLLALDDFYLTEITFYTKKQDSTSGYSYELAVYIGSEAGTQIVKQDFDETTINYNGWTTVQLTSPIQIDASKDLWFGVYHDSGTNPPGYLFGVDNGPAVGGKGDVIIQGAGIDYLSSSSIDRNWNLSATVVNYLEESIQDQSMINKALKFDLPLEGYNIYRDDIKINTTPIIEKTFSDTSLAFGNYDYFVTAIYNTGQSIASNIINILVNAGVIGPLAEFSGTPVSGNTPLVVQFTDASTQGTNTITSWNWDFGDGNTSTIQNPEHTYITSDTYTVSMTVSDGSLADIETKSNYITVSSITAPTADFSGTPTSGYAPLVVQFTDASLHGTDSIYLWNWFFGDGKVSTTQDPEHTYTYAGTFDVSLSVSNSFLANIVTKTNYITVYENLTVEAGVDQSINTGTSTTLDGSFTGGSGNVEILWAPQALIVSNGILNPQTNAITSDTTFYLTVTDLLTSVAKTDSVQIGMLVGIDEYINEGLKAYPNPVKDKLIINLGDVKVEGIQLFNSSGKKMYSLLGNEIQSEIIEIYVSEFSPGTYYLNIYTEEGVIRRKILVVR